MKRAKRLFGVLVTLILLCTISISALAVYNINFWVSDKSRVSYNPYDGSYCLREYGTNDAFRSNFRTAVSHAKQQWSKILPLTISERSESYALNEIYAGTYTQLLSTFPDLARSNSGLTYTTPNDFQTTVHHFGGAGDVDVYAIRAGGRMCVVQSLDSTLDNYKNTATHEMGHLFGWDGHSLSSSDIMYEVKSEITTIGASEGKHLSQIYDLFF